MLTAPTTKAIRAWRKKLTPAQSKAIAKAAKTSVVHLNHMAAGRRGATAEMAQRLAAASRTLGTRDLYLDQRDICMTCARCPIVDKRMAPPKAVGLRPKSAVKPAP